MVVNAGGGHIQSLLLGAVLLVLSFLSGLMGIISDLIRTNRVLIEDVLEHTKKMRFKPTGQSQITTSTSSENGTRSVFAEVGQRH
jgi:Na+-transporting methylmalonyl-CoA/oxaloacetate decarboxylase gamma subunit